MYRMYEDPYYLEGRLREAKENLALAEDEEDRIYLHEEVAELEERLNFAWQDDEFEMEECV